MQVVVDSLAVQYERLGDEKQKKLLILHGWGDSSKGWHAAQAALAKTYDVLAVDLPGFGGSEAPKTPWGLDDYAAFVAAFLRKLKLRPYAMVAHSNGGAIALRGLGNDVLHTERLVLLDSAGIRGEYKGRLKALRIIAKAGKALTYPLPASVKKRLRHRMYTTVGSDMLVAEHLQETFKKVVTDDVQCDAVKVTVPTLLLYGEDDMATPPMYGRILHNLIGGSKFELIAGAGHFVHLDKPAETLRLVEKFLQ